MNDQSKEIARKKHEDSIKYLYFSRYLAVLSVICAIVAFLVWYPFIKHYDNVLLKKEKTDAAK